MRKCKRKPVKVREGGSKQVEPSREKVKTEEEKKDVSK